MPHAQAQAEGEHEHRGHERRGGRPDREAADRVFALGRPGDGGSRDQAGPRRACRERRSAHARAQRVRSRSSPFAWSRWPALTRSDGNRPLALSGNRSRRAFTVLSTLLCLHRHGPRNRRSSRGPRSSEGRRQARLHLEGLHARRRDNSRRPRGHDCGRPRDHWRWLVTGRRRPDRRDLGAGQQEQRIQIPIRLRGPSHAEVDEGHGQLDHAARADGPDQAALRDGHPAAHGDRAEMQERDRVTVIRLERDRSAAHRDGAGEGDDPGRRGEHGRTGWSADVDAAVLARRIRIVAEQEGPQNRSLHRPGPTQSGRRHREGSRDRSAEEQSNRHRAPPIVVRYGNYAQGSRAGRSLSNLITTKCGRAGCALLR